MGREEAEEFSELDRTETGEDLFSKKHEWLKSLAPFALGAAVLAGCGGAVKPSSSTSAPSAPISSPNTLVLHTSETESCCGGMVYRSRATGYYPSSNALEGGFRDRQGKRLQTLQDFLNGRAKYVAVAMDSTVFSYGAKLCIPRLNARYGMKIPFRVVDTGGAFRKKGTNRIDICTRGLSDARDPEINRSLEIIRCDP